MFAILVSILIGMMNQGHGTLPNMVGRDFSYRIPPQWSPEMESTYSFRAYMTDISLWVLLTDRQPHQQCAAIIMRLGGAARELARVITPVEMVNGGMRHGVQVDLVTYLLGAIHARFAALEEESRITCMTGMLAFARKPGESINALLARYETVRQRAAIEGQFQMSIEGCSLQLLRACGIQSSHLVMLLQPFQGRFPQTEAEFQAMTAQLRIFGHIHEGTQGNIAQALNGHWRQARAGSYVSDQQAYQHVARSGYQHGAQNMQTFFGNTQERANEGPWSALNPQDPFPIWGVAAGQEQAYPTQQEPYHQEDHTTAYPSYEDADDVTGTDTSSDSYNEQLEGEPTHTYHHSDADLAEQLFMAYRRHKRIWRRYTGKPLRRFRRVMKWYKRRRGKGGKGFYWTHEEVHAYLRHNGKRT